MLHKVFQPLYYAREDTRSPFRFAVWSMIVNAAVAVGLLPLIGFSAAALATTISGWMMVLQLWLGTRKMGDEARFDDRFRHRLPRILIASVIMGAALVAAELALGPALGTPGWRYAALAALCTAGIAAYAAAALALGAMRLSDLKAALRRQR